MSTKKAIAIKRISNDIRELQKCPLEGIGMASIDNNPMEYVINMELMMGPYQGYKLQLKMTIPDEYPIKPPKILIYPGKGSIVTTTITSTATTKVTKGSASTSSTTNFTWT